MRRRVKAAGALIALALVPTTGWLASQAEGAVPAWTTYRHDAARSGIDPDSGTSVPPAQAWQTNPALDGDMFGSPLVYRSRVYAATENNSIYALDASTGAVVWRTHVAAPVPEGSSTTGCGDVNPVGITGTPVIDPVTQRIFAVAETWNGSDPFSIEHVLVGLNLVDGSLAPGLPAAVDPPGAKSRYLLQRPGLALDGGRVVIGYGGNAGDCGEYTGWVTSVAENGSALKAFQVSPDRGGAVWGAGTGLPVDASGAVWAETGNGFSGSLAYQESVLKLDATMNLLDRWTPANWSDLDSGDADLGSSEPLLLPGGLVFVIGKEGVGTLLAASHLGGVGGAPVFQASVCSGGSFGGAIYVGGVIYVTCNGIQALALNPATRTFAPLPGWHVTGGAAGPPVFAGGLVWATDWRGSTLYGLDPSTGAVMFSPDLGGFDHFAAPSAGGGRLFVANGDKVTAFTIATQPPPSATTTTLPGSRVRTVQAGARLTFTASVGGPAGPPDAGSVAFLDGTAPVPGCATVPVAPAVGSASCTAVYTRRGTHAVKAVYSGDSYYLASASTPADVTVVVSEPPKLSRLRVGVSGKRVVTLKLTLSEAATLTLSGRHFKTRHLRGHAGANTLQLGRLHPGRYTLILVASDKNHQRSRRYTLRFRIK